MQDVLNELEFLQHVDENPVYYEKQVVKNAIRRWGQFQFGRFLTFKFSGL